MDVVTMTLPMEWNVTFLSLNDAVRLIWSPLKFRSFSPEQWYSKFCLLNKPSHYVSKGKNKIFFFLIRYQIWHQILLDCRETRSPFTIYKGSLMCLQHNIIYTVNNYQLNPILNIDLIPLYRTFGIRCFPF